MMTRMRKHVGHGAKKRVRITEFTFKRVKFAIQKDF